MNWYEGYNHPDNVGSPSTNNGNEYINNNFYDNLASNLQSFNVYESTGTDTLFTSMTEAELDDIIAKNAVNSDNHTLPSQISATIASNSIAITAPKKRGRPPLTEEANAQRVEEKAAEKLNKRQKKT